MGKGEEVDLPLHAEALFYLGTAYVRKGQNDAAAQVFGLTLDALKRSLSSPPLNENWIRSRMLNNKCWVEAVSGIDLDAALSDCDQSLSLAPNDADTLNGRAFALYRQKKFKEALGGFDSTLNIKSDDVEALFMRGVVKLQVGDEAGGMTDVKAARSKDANIDALYSGYGIAVK
jgi:tetratricopeptide (TPR) repeat protein